MDLKYIQASFAGGKTVTTVPATKYDSGQFLKITGIELPSAFEVHFGNSGLAEYIVVAGTTSDGISVTQIPNILLKDSGPIIAYIYLTVSESTRTVYVINIPVIERAGYEPTSSDPNDPHYISGISELIEAANQDVETASEAAETSEAAKTEAIEAKEDSVFSREAAETAMEQAIAAKNEILASIDQTYSSISENAQSGVAVAQAIADKVDDTTTICSKPLTDSVQLTVDDIYMEDIPEYTTLGQKLIEQDAGMASLNTNKVNNFTTINDKALDSNVQLTAEDISIVGLGEHHLPMTNVNQALGYLGDMTSALPTTSQVDEIVTGRIYQEYNEMNPNAMSGVAVSQALNTTKPKLIIDYTTTEDINTITFNDSILLDSNYGFANYSHFIVIARMKFLGTATFEVKGKYAEIDTSAILNYGSSVNGLNDCVYKGWYFEVMIKNRTPIFLGGIRPMANNSVDNCSAIYMRCQPNNDDYNLQKYASLTILDRASSANTILAGTNFKIWGVND